CARHARRGGLGVGASAACPFTPPSKTLSTFSAISHAAARSASSEKKLSGRGELRQPHELELGRADFPRPIQIHVTEPSLILTSVLALSATYTVLPPRTPFVVGGKRRAGLLRAHPSGPRARRDGSSDSSGSLRCEKTARNFRSIVTSAADLCLIQIRPCDRFLLTAREMPA